MKLWYLCFVKGGGAFFEADTIQEAAFLAWAYGANPGGAILGLEVPPGLPELPSNLKNCYVPQDELAAVDKLLFGDAPLDIDSMRSVSKRKPNYKEVN
jgi:hypothetical protein